jgi:hypothetical protein
MPLFIKEDEYVTAVEAASLLRLSKQRVSQLTRDGTSSRVSARKERGSSRSRPCSPGNGTWASVVTQNWRGCWRRVTTDQPGTARAGGDGRPDRLHDHRP